MGIREYVDATCGDTTPPGEIPFEQWVRDQIQAIYDKIAQLEAKVNQLGSGVGMVLSGTAQHIWGGATPGTGVLTAAGANVNIGCGTECGPSGSILSRFCNITDAVFNEIFPPQATGATMYASGMYRRGVFISIPTTGTVTRASIFSTTSDYCLGTAEAGWTELTMADGSNTTVDKGNNGGWHEDTFASLPWGLIRYSGTNIFSRGQYTRWNLPGATYRAGFSAVADTSIWVNAGDFIIAYLAIPGAGGDQYSDYGGGRIGGRLTIPQVNVQIILRPGG